MTFSATRLRKPMAPCKVPRYTSPKAPVPMRRSTSYRPSRRRRSVMGVPHSSSMETLSGASRRRVRPRLFSMKNGSSPRAAIILRVS